MKKYLSKKAYKFSFSSIISFIIDYLLYSLNLLIIKNITISNILARIISSITNFNINKRYVFKSDKKIKYELLSYYILAFIIITLNTIILNLLSLIINPYISKIITELILFIFSYFIQKKYIFK